MRGLVLSYFQWKKTKDAERCSELSQNEHITVTESTSFFYRIKKSERVFGSSVKKYSVMDAENHSRKVRKHDPEETHFVGEGKKVDRS